MAGALSAPPRTASLVLFSKIPYLDLQNLRKMELTRLYYNLFPVRCSYEFALVVRTLFVRCSRVVRTSSRTLFARCSYAVRTLFARSSRVVRTLFTRCSYAVRTSSHERELTRELRDAPVWEPWSPFPGVALREEAVSSFCGGFSRMPYDGAYSPVLLAVVTPSSDCLLSQRHLGHRRPRLQMDSPPPRTT